MFLWRRYYDRSLLNKKKEAIFELIETLQIVRRKSLKTNDASI